MEREEYVGLGVFWRKRRLNLLVNLMLDEFDEFDDRKRAECGLSR